MTSLAKGGIATAALGTAATGAYAGSIYLKESVSKRLSDEGYTLISSIKNPEHEALQWKEEFKSDKTAIKTLLKLTDDNDDLGGKSLKSWCSSKLSESYSEKLEHLESVKKYCTLKTIGDWLTRNNKKLLTNDSENGSKWDATYNKRKTAKTSRALVGLADEWPQDSTDKKEADLPIIKRWCESTSRTHFKAYEQTFTHVKEWCTEGGTA
ncbi:hypothetical protein HF1_04110 [Mycoplasma haemofelis str. Langford 1]|uniref:Uncharacterized protein n=1 Tax=Mycoplasma haemofelis (strain Langford 1) TaxID=941640 RepID=E8ZGZ8_MYCHL|nr:hypothetical protein [Mycoplasma haemofelis]CBY92419.1 hypothetical protein HF1_04110 [Mycoplasma haemofelis str. Langford 1]